MPCGSGAEELPYTSFASTDTQPHVPSGLASGNAGDPYYSPTSGVPVQAHGTSQANNYAVSGYPPPPNYTYDVQPGVYAPQAGYGAPGEASQVRHHRANSIHAPSYHDPSQMAPYAGSMYHPGHGNKGGRMVSDTGPYSHTTASGGSSPPSRTSTQFVPTPAQTLQTYGSGASAPSTGSRAAFLPAGSRHARSQSLTTIQIPEHPAGASTATPVQRWQCGQCDTTFSRAHDRTRHIQTHHRPDSQRHRCPDCTRPFSRSDALKRHRDSGCRGPSPP